MEFSFSAIWATMTPIVKVITILLCFMSVYSLGLSLERWWTFRAAKAQSVKFALEIGPLLKQDKLKEAIDLAKKYKASHVAKVVSAGLLEFAYEAHGGAGAGQIGHDSVAAAERAIERASMMTTAECKKGLGGLATIATTSPFIGLLATVIGIINAFRGMAVTGSGGIGAVAGGIAEALVTTAFGIGVAIIALWCYNLLNSKIEVYDAEMSNTASQVIDFFVRKQAK